LCEQEIVGAYSPFLRNTSFDIAHQIKADEKTRMFLDAYQAQRMQTNVRRHYTSDLTVRRCSPYGAYTCPGRMTG
jgi:hypothetical protein